MKNTLYLIVGLVVILGSFYLFLQKHVPLVPDLNDANSTSTPPAITGVRIGSSGVIAVEIADTPEEISLGLSGRESLMEGTGLLFMFEIPAKYGFWMKDMMFSIDIIWIDENWKIVDIHKNVKPETFPDKFSPKTPAQYVLEVPSGTTEQNRIDIGQEVFLIGPN